MPGQPLLFLGTVVLLWTAARIFHHLPNDDLVAALVQTAPTRSTGFATARAGPRLKTPGTPAQQSSAAASIKSAGRPRHASRQARHPIFANERIGAGIAMAQRLAWVEGVAFSTEAAGRTSPPLAGSPLPLGPERAALPPFEDGLEAAPDATPSFPDRKSVV